MTTFDSIAGPARSPHSLLSAAAVLALATSANVARSAEDSAPDAGIEEVIVSAERREESVQRVPSAISVIGGADVTDRDIRNSKDIIRFVPNMNADTSDAHMRPKWYIRGIGRSDASLQAVSQVGIYYDDVYIQNASSSGFPIFDLDRVEVLRGPQGTLWGKNTVGGAVNFLSRKPTFDSNGYAKLAYGNYGNVLAEAAYGGAVKDDVLAARISGTWEKSDTYIQNSFLPGTDTWSDGALRLQLLARFGDSADGLLSLRYRRFHGPVLRSYDTTSATQSAKDVPSLVKADDVFEQKGVSFSFNKTFQNDWKFTSISAFDDFDRESSGGDQVPYESARTAGGFTVRQISQEVRLASPDDVRFKWIVGAHAFDEELKSQSYNANLPGSRTATGAARAQSYRAQSFDLGTRSYALFGSSTYAVTSRFDLTTGLRRTRETKDIDLLARSARAGFVFTNISSWYSPSLIQGTFATNATQVDERTWSATTYDVTPKFEVTDHFRIYGRVAKGFSSGNYNANATTQSAVGVLDPENLLSYEAGFKSEWIDNRVQLNGAVFYYDYDDIQQNVMSLDAFGALVNTSRNAGAGYSKGAELELRALPLRNLEIGLNVGYANTKFTDFQATPQLNVAGNWFNRVPRWTSNVSVDYKLPLPTGAAFEVGTDWAIRSRAYFNAVDQTTPSLLQPGYSIGNASVGFLTPEGRYAIRAYTLNVADKVYKHTQLIGSNASSFAAPRTYGVSVTAKF